MSAGHEKSISLGSIGGESPDAAARNGCGPTFQCRFVSPPLTHIQAAYGLAASVGDLNPAAKQHSFHAARAEQ